MGIGDWGLGDYKNKLITALLLISDLEYNIRVLIFN